MKDKAIVATARSPIGRAYKGAFNHIQSPTLLGHALQHAAERAQLDPHQIDDVVVGTVLRAGTAKMNVTRSAALAAGLFEVLV